MTPAESAAGRAGSTRRDGADRAQAVLEPRRQGVGAVLDPSLAELAGAGRRPRPAPSGARTSGSRRACRARWRARRGARRHPGAVGPPVEGRDRRPRDAQRRPRPDEPGAARAEQPLVAAGGEGSQPSGRRSRPRPRSRARRPRRPVVRRSVASPASAIWRIGSFTPVTECTQVIASTRVRGRPPRRALETISSIDARRRRGTGAPGAPSRRRAPRSRRRLVGRVEVVLGGQHLVARRRAAGRCTAARGPSWSSRSGDRPARRPGTRAPRRRRPARGRPGGRRGRRGRPRSRPRR